MTQQQSSGSVPHDWSHIDPAWGNWLAGFIDGEGCFTIRRRSRGRGYTCQFSLRLRRDDRPILVEIQQTVGFGHVVDGGHKPSVTKPNPQSGWDVVSFAESHRLVTLLDCFPLRAKKARDYAIWREAVLIVVRRGPRVGKRNVDWGRTAELRKALSEGRRYNLADGVIPMVPRPTYIQEEFLSGHD